MIPPRDGRTGQSMVTGYDHYFAMLQWTGHGVAQIVKYFFIFA